MPQLSTHSLILEMRDKIENGKISRKKIAEKAGLTTQAIWHWEKESRDPGLRSFEAVIQILGGRIKIEWD